MVWHLYELKLKNFKHFFTFRANISHNIRLLQKNPANIRCCVPCVTKRSMRQLLFYIGYLQRDVGNFKDFHKTF